MNFLKMSVKISAIKKIDVYNEIFKCLNNDLINVFARKFKVDRHKSFEIKTKFLRVIHEVLFKSAQFSRNLDFFINHDFLNIRLKCSRND